MVTDIAELPAINIANVSKRLGKRVIFYKLNLVVPSGQICGLSGPNGSGKSMLLRIVSGLVRPDDGEVSVFGERIGKDAEFPKQTGVLIESPGLLLHHSAFQNLRLLAMIRNQITQTDIIATLRLVGLDASDRRPVRTYSTGMCQRLGIAQALMEKPRLLLLDEPTTALDSAGVQDIHRLLRDLKVTGVTILLTSHNQDELRTLCDAVSVLENAGLVRQKAPQILA